MTRNSATKVSLEKFMVNAPTFTTPMPMQSAFTSAMMSAARKAPRMATGRRALKSTTSPPSATATPGRISSHSLPVV